MPAGFLRKAASLKTKGMENSAITPRPQALDTNTTPAYTPVEYSGPRRRRATRRQIRANTRLARLLEQSYPRLADAILLCLEEGARPCKRVRFCAVCTRIKQWKLLRSYAPKLQAMAEPHFLTLATYPVTTLRMDNVRALAGRFAAIRRLARFRRAVRGGVASTEIKHGENGWQVHLHAVTDLRTPLAARWLATEWMRRGGGHHVKLQPFRTGSPARAFTYIVKQPVFPNDAELVRQFASATADVRLLQSWGSFFGKPRLTATPEE